jgi:hypothetical protein
VRADAAAGLRAEISKAQRVTGVRSSLDRACAAVRRIGASRARVTTTCNGVGRRRTPRRRRRWLRRRRPPRRSAAR